MNTRDERREEIGSELSTDSTADGSRTERLPSGRRLDMRPRRPKTLLLFTISMTLLLIGALLVIRSNRLHSDSDTAAPPVDKSEPATITKDVPPEPLADALERRIDEVAAQLARFIETTDRKIEQNATAVGALEDKLATLPTAERVAAIEDTLNQSQDTLTKDLARLEQSLARMRRPATVAKPIEPTLPFRAVSLDLWEGVPYAGLLFDGRIESLRVGQARGGWAVDHIDYGAGKVQFRNGAGQTIERTPRK
jgi:hypothetical protein